MSRITVKDGGTQIFYKDWVRGSNAKRIVYPGAPHGLAQTHQEKFNANLLAFIRAAATAASKAA